MCICCVVSCVPVCVVVHCVYVHMLCNVLGRQVWDCLGTCVMRCQRGRYGTTLAHEGVGLPWTIWCMYVVNEGNKKQIKISIKILLNFEPLNYKSKYHILIYDGLDHEPTISI